MLSFKLQRQTVVALVGLTFLCILPSVAALDVRTTAFAPSSTSWNLFALVEAWTLTFMTSLITCPFNCFYRLCGLSSTTWRWTCSTNFWSGLLSFSSSPPSPDSSEFHLVNVAMCWYGMFEYCATKLHKDLPSISFAFVILTTPLCYI